MSPPEQKTLWDWLELLVIPAVLTFSVLIIEISEGRREEKNLSEQYKQDILRDYFSEMNNIVFNKNKLEALKKNIPYSPEREILGSRTITTLDILEDDPERKSQLIRFIGNSSLSRYIPIRRANLHNLDLSNLDLTGADLRLTTLFEANLEGANLSESSLEGTNLSESNLKRVNLCRADLSKSNLKGANLEGANLSESNLEGASLCRADLSKSNLEGANLCRADLSKSNLEGASLTGAKYNHKTKLPKNILSIQTQSMKELNSDNCENKNMLAKLLEKVTFLFFIMLFNY